MLEYRSETWWILHHFPISILMASLFALSVRAALPDATFEDWRRQREAQRAANLQEFVKAFEQGKSLNVRERLERAATVTGELAALAEMVTDKDIAQRMAQGGYTTRTPIYPRENHLIRLMGTRPWIRDQFRGELGELAFDSAESRWPTTQEQPELRQLVRDTDPDVRAMAVEALASLYDPDDLKLIAKSPTSFPALFGGSSPTVPVLSTQDPIWANGWPDQGNLKDPLRFDLYWRPATVTEHVERALRQLTGANVTLATFDQWVARHGATRESMWYWQQRLQREFSQHEMSTRREIPDNEPESMRLLTSKNAEFRKSIRTELAKLDRQTEAKVLLIAKHPHSGTTDINEPFQRFFDPPWQTRLTKDELFTLLEGGQPWADVDWVDQSGSPAELRNQVVTRIMLSANLSFAQQDLPRLQKLLDRPTSEIWPEGRAAILIGSSRLLPAATPAELQRLENSVPTGPQTTRDGYLRKVIHQEHVTVKGYVATELIRVALPPNASFLREHFFAEENGDVNPDLRGSILLALGQAPLSKEKRKFLVELISDKRCRSILTRRIEKNVDLIHRGYAIKSIVANAGQDMVNISDLHNLFHPDKAGESLDRILESLKQW